MMDGANYVVSRTGALAYVPLLAQARSFVWVDRAGRETAIDALPPRPYETIGLSRDGTRLAFAVFDREMDIWTWDFARESLTRLTFGSSLELLPRWTPDGRRVVFQSYRDGPANLYSVASDGSGAVERLTTSNNVHYPNSIAPDGTVLFAELRPKTGFDILRLPVATPQGAGIGPRPVSACPRRPYWCPVLRRSTRRMSPPMGATSRTSRQNLRGGSPSMCDRTPMRARDGGRFRPGAERHLCGRRRDASCSILMNQTP